MNNPPATRPGELPPGYREALYWKITGQASRMVLLQLLALPLLVAACLVFFGLAVLLGRHPTQFSFTAGEIVVTLVGVVLIMILHELAHGLAMRAFGAHPQYGLLLKEAMLYATAPGFAFRRDHYLTIALAPLVSLSLLSALGLRLLAGTPWVLPLAVSAAINAAGAVGDLWISRVVLRYPAESFVMDERDGVRIYLPD